MFEVELNSDRRQDTSLQHYLQTIGKFKLLTKEEEKELARRIRQGNKEALDRLVNANLRFVVSVAKNYQNRGLSTMDLIAEGNLGLITAAKRFDERRDFRFISYAVWWIRQAIQKAMADQVNTVRLPMNRSQQAYKMRLVTKKFEQKNRREIRHDELAEALNLSERKVRQIRGASGPLVSLDQTFGEDQTTMAETLVDSDRVSPEEDFIRVELGVELREALVVLTSRERLVITKYFGLDQSGEKSLEAIGQQIHLSRERVRQIRNQALQKIREASRSDRLAHYLVS